MADLIDRKAAIKVIHDYCMKLILETETKTTDDGEVYDLNIVNPILQHNKAISNALKALPSAEQTSAWIKRTFAPDCIGYTCRRCNHTYDAVTNYCPNCGARMEE